MTIDLDEAKDRAERGLLTARHGEALVAELKRLSEQLRNYQEGFKREEVAASAYREQVRFLSAKVMQYDEREPFVREMVAAELENEHDGCSMCSLAKAVRDFKVDK